MSVHECTYFAFSQWKTELVCLSSHLRDPCVLYKLIHLEKLSTEIWYSSFSICKAYCENNNDNLTKRHQKAGHILPYDKPPFKQISYTHWIGVSPILLKKKVKFKNLRICEVVSVIWDRRLFRTTKISHFTDFVKSLQSCPTLCDPIDGSPPGSPVPGILQAGTPEWVAISFSNAWKWKAKVNSFSRVRLLVTPWTAAYQVPLSMGFSRQVYWSWVPSPSPILQIGFVYNNI